jgi:hypothetical protein
MMKSVVRIVVNLFMVIGLRATMIEEWCVGGMLIGNNENKTE